MLLKTGYTHSLITTRNIKSICLSQSLYLQWRSLWCAIGVAIAFFKYARQEVSSVAPENVSIFTKIARQDLMQDRFNEAVFMRPGQALTTTLVAVDEAVVDGAVRGVGQVAMGSGSALRGLQNGYVRSYAAMILVGAIALIGAIWVVVQ
jgi:NADH-quinone oxidoreductase subunit L